MIAASSPVSNFSSAWEVLVLFLIPVGGGIPAGVVLAQSRGIQWPEMTALYFVSDVILACVFEPIMRLLIAAGTRSAYLAKLGVAWKKSVQASTAAYGNTLGPLALVMVSFGVDPMTGRTAAVVKGHGFVSGWALAITGDMLYFLLLMSSTLWLSNLLGDGTKAMLIILGLTMLGPPLVRHLRLRWRTARRPA